MSGWQLAREEIIAIKAYRAAEQVRGAIRLNANEAPKPIIAGSDGSGLNRYPNVHPVQLQSRMSAVFGVPSNGILVTRGSSEAIDAIVRTFCRAYEDNVLIMPPTFEMYRFYADVQGVSCTTIGLAAEDDFAVDVEAVLAACDDRTKLIFVCTPNNPTGRLVPAADIAKLAIARRNKSIIVVDEAYIEFSEEKSMTAATAQHDNLVVLRTLSKAHALAGARCGAAIACSQLIDVIYRVLPPYSFPTPVIDSVTASLGAAEIDKAETALGEIVHERDRLFMTLGTLAIVDKVWPSQANFLLVRFRDLARVQACLQRHKILVRDVSSESGLQNCARITAGSRAENNALLGALRACETTQ
jgi:histidinol-phosphate aminotransferase